MFMPFRTGFRWDKLRLVVVLFVGISGLMVINPTIVYCSSHLLVTSKGSQLRPVILLDDEVGLLGLLRGFQRWRAGCQQGDTQILDIQRVRAVVSRE